MGRAVLGGGDWGSRDALPLEARPSVLPASRGRGAGSDAEPHPGRQAGRARRGLWPAAGSLSAPSPPCGCGAVPCSRARGRYHPPDSSKHALVRGWRVGGPAGGLWVALILSTVVF